MNSYEYTREQATRTKIRAANFANKLANEWEGKLGAVAKNFAGKKILKADGSLTKAFSDALPNLRHDDKGYFLYRPHYSRYSLDFVVKVQDSYPAENARDTYRVAVYHEVHISLGKISGDTLAELYPAQPTRRTDYTYEEVVAARTEIEAAEKILSDAKAKLPSFLAS